MGRCRDRSRTRGAHWSSERDRVRAEAALDGHGCVVVCGVNDPHIHGGFARELVPDAGRGRDDRALRFQTPVSDRRKRPKRNGSVWRRLECAGGGRRASGERHGYCQAEYTVNPKYRRAAEKGFIFLNSEHSAFLLDVSLWLP